MKQDILFLVDHKHRDLPGLASIGHYLMESGYSISFRNVWDYKYLFKDPSAIVIPKANHGVESFIRHCQEWRNKRKKIIVIETEGNEQWEIGSKRMTIVPDLFLFWNEIEKSKHSDYLKRNNIKNAVVGSPRLDSFKPQIFNLITDKIKIQNDYDIDISKKTITIATNNSYDGLSKEKIARIKERYNRVYNNCEFDKYYNFMLDVRKTNIKYLKYIVENFRDFNIVVKPHPNEDISFWKNFLNDYKNVKLMFGKNINDLLCVSDLHIGMTVCLTIIEANLLNIPTIELMPNNIHPKKLFGRDHIGIGSYIVDNYDDLTKSIIDGVVSKNRANSKFEEYIKKYFYKFDGYRCKAYADEIINFLKDQPSSPYNKLYFFNYLFYSLKKIKLLLNKLNKVDFRGRYDNRIKPGDEKSWLSLYQNIN